ncbi:HRDC-like protein [Mycotypha africana]|uniref:HRDC-like protein n=1 Tax=Mycotypha africana TaxID=64632 RepID=UPI0023006B16|nr:HRDC-like protein [Mycotypha africana]KAI8967880.1 HRDC-like protein [Mycotypha africana]
MSAARKAIKRRHIHRNAEQEDATTLKLGEEFESAQCLYISEVKVILEAKEDNKDLAKDRQKSNILQKTLDYVRKFSKFSNIESVREVRQVLSRDNLTLFEVAQMANLCCDEAEEVKALIPR